MRLDSLGKACSDNPDFAVVHDALRDALEEVRAISKGLRLPELEAVPVGDVLERAIVDHERHCCSEVKRAFERLPEVAPLAVKIAPVRTLQEALSNATRHAPGAEVVVRAGGQGGYLYLEIADTGPGFDFNNTPGVTAGHLGLAGMRERAELLGGTFLVRTAPGSGTTVRACWPLSEHVKPD